MKNKIAIVGHRDHGNSVLQEAIKKSLSDSGHESEFIAPEQAIREQGVVIVREPTFTVNNIEYRERQLSPSTRRGSATMAALASIYASVGMFSLSDTRSYKKQMPEYNLLDEVKLIQEKKSKFSRSEREYVMREFNKLFEPVQKTNEPFKL